MKMLVKELIEKRKDMPPDDEINIGILSDGILKVIENPFDNNITFVPKKFFRYDSFCPLRLENIKPDCRIIVCA